MDNHFHTYENISLHQTSGVTGRERSSTRVSAFNLSIIGGEQDQSATPQRIRGGTLGRGYNVLDGVNKIQLFDKLEADYLNGNGKAIENTDFFADYLEYEKELSKKVDLKYIEGMFSLYCAEEHDSPPLLCKIEKIDNWHHLVHTIEEDFFSLRLKRIPELSVSIYSDKDVQYILSNKFSRENRHHFYAVFNKFGTHWVRSVNFGAKAELRWSFAEKMEKDTIGKLSNTHKVQNGFKEKVDKWKQSKFCLNDEEKKKFKDVEEHQRQTDNFLLSEHEKQSHPCQIGFQLEEISMLFPSAASDISLAIKAYLAEMQPKRDMNKIKENSVIAIYCIDTHQFLEVDHHGHLKPSLGDGVKLANKFEVKKKGNRIGLKSLLFSSKFLSRAMTKSIFHFHRLQYMGPHESFQISGDYMYSCGSLHSPSLLYIGDDNQVHHDGSMAKHKNRFCILEVECRVFPGEIETNIEMLEPIYLEDSLTEVALEVHVVNYHSIHRAASEDLIDKLAEVAKVNDVSLIHKSNSTSSLFIKETILLPNVDELSRRIAYKLHSMINEGQKVVNPIILDMFSEEKHPLTKGTQLDKPPSVETIYHFLNTIFKVEKLHPEPGIMSLIYLNRMITKTKLTLNAKTWRRAVVSTIILASKVWEDLAVWNVDFLELFPNITVRDLNHMERVVLDSIDFNVTIKAAEYVKSFFDLSQYAELGRTGDERPMSVEDLSKLEVKTASSEKEFFKLQLHKSSSLVNIVRPEKKKKSLAILS